MGICPIIENRVEKTAKKWQLRSGVIWGIIQIGVCEVVF